MKIGNFDLQERWYLTEARQALLTDIKDYNPVVAIPTGGGKTVVISCFIYDMLSKDPDLKFLVLADSYEIVRQDHKTVATFFPDQEIGLYCASLGSKTIRNITVANIKSIHSKASKFADFDIVIVDECHTIPDKPKSMYRRFLNDIEAKYVGFSATIFRTKSGYVHKAKNRIFDKLSYDLTKFDSFNRLIKDGYLCDMISRPTKLQLDTKNIKDIKGDFCQKQLSDRNDRDEITKKAVDEVIYYGKDRKSWLVFAIDINHANNINKFLLDKGINSKVLHTRMDGDRDQVISEIKKSKIRALVSVGMITVGFDAPNIDMIVLLRPTKSPVLHIQMLGRGFRPYLNKPNCLVLDLSDNIRRLGPINDVKVPVPGKKNGKGQIPIKECPKCGCLNHISARKCNACNHVFVFKQKIRERINTHHTVLAKDKKKTPRIKETWKPVKSINYFVHRKAGRPPSLRVEYITFGRSINEYICIEHEGYPKQKAYAWVQGRLDKRICMPKTTKDLYNQSVNFRQPHEILVKHSYPYPKILKYRFKST
jgi:DNA repair protein RadD